ncbi:MAG: glycosyltransferase family 4 protein [Planctomycetaceae bacterium]|nr:glycosyltransferase family 4 protein [Planctomycetaceae bacterium]
MPAVPMLAERCETPRGGATNAPLRLLHVVAGNLYGGVERMLATIASHQSACTGSHHEFAVCFPGRVQDELMALGATVHGLGHARFSRPWTVLSARRRLRSIIAAERFDVVLFHGCWPLATLGWRTASTGCRSVLWLHDAVRGRHWVERLARRRHVDHFVANSRWVLECATRWRPGVPGEAICCPVELPAHPLPRSGRVRREFGCRDETVVIVQVSRLEEWKGHRRLIDAARRLRASHSNLPAWEIWFVGGPQRPHEAEYLTALQREVAAAQLTDVVRWLGPRRDVDEILADADVFCQPNLSPEPLGIVFLEAMAQGLPIVSTDFGGARELVPPSAGRLIPPDDTAAIAEALAQLTGDAAQRASMQSAGPGHARRLADPAARLKDLERLLAVPVTGGRA